MSNQHPNSFLDLESVDININNGTNTTTSNNVRDDNTEDAVLSRFYQQQHNLEHRISQQRERQFPGVTFVRNDDILNEGSHSNTNNDDLYYSNSNDDDDIYDDEDVNEYDNGNDGSFNGGTPTNPTTTNGDAALMKRMSMAGMIYHRSASTKELTDIEEEEQDPSSNNKIGTDYDAIELQDDSYYGDEEKGLSKCCHYTFTVAYFLVTISFVFIALMVSGKFDVSSNHAINLDRSGSITTTNIPKQKSLEFQQAYYDTIMKHVLQDTANNKASGVWYDDFGSNDYKIQALEWLAFEDTLYLLPPNVHLHGHDSAESSSNVSDYHPDRFYQRYVLAVLYYANNGHMWSTLSTVPDSGWMTFGIGKHECDWYFVDCSSGKDSDEGGSDSVNHIVKKPHSESSTTSTTSTSTNSPPPHRQHHGSIVTSVRLSGSGVTMTGSIVSEITMLSHLQHLDLSLNRLEGTIPDEIYAKLPNLLTLDLSHNQLVGTISSKISHLTNLEALILSDNDFTGSFPSSPSSYSVSTSTPMTMNHLSNLEILHLNRNRELHGSIDGDVLSTFGKLQSLDISETKFNGMIPPCHSDDSQATSSIGTSTRAEVVPTNDEGPDDRGNGNVTDTGIIDANLDTTTSKYFLESCDTLQDLILSNAMVSGTIPTEIGLATNLKTLEIVEAPGIVGTIPTELGLCTNLKELQFNYVNFGPGTTLPTELSNIHKLQTLDIRWSNLSGTLPKEYGGTLLVEGSTTTVVEGGMKSLVTMDMSHNEKLVGTLPIEYGNLSNLKNLLLEQTSLQCSVLFENSNDGEDYGVCSLPLLQFTMDCSIDGKQLICDGCDECL